MNMTVADIAKLVGGSIVGDGTIEITGVNGIQEAEAGDLCFIRGARYLPYLETTRASAVLVAEAVENSSVTAILVPQPDLAFAMVLQRFAMEQTRHPAGIHDAAVIDDAVQLGKDVGIDAHVRIAEGAVIGDRVVLYAGVYVGRNTVIGDDTVVFPNVTLREETQIGARCVLHAGATIGSDGFGFAPLDGKWMKIPQVGRVILEDDVEVGANTAIDRATFGVTRVRQGTKIDNLVQIGHNVQIGEHCAMAGMSGVAGSAVLGNHVRVGANSAIAGHIDVGDGVTIAARAGVTKSVPAGKTVSGFPAIAHEKERRVVVAHRRGPEMLKRLRQLEQHVEQLKELLHEQAENNS